VTLSIAVLTHSFACAVTDRRISYTKGQRPDDEFDKTCTLSTRDAKVAVSFAGIARSNLYDSHVKLLERLKSRAAPDFTLFGLVTRLTEQLNEDFLKHRDIKRLSLADRRFSISFVGFAYCQLGKGAVFGLISNYEDAEEKIHSDEAWAEFRPFMTFLPTEVPSAVIAIGRRWSVDQKKVADRLAAPGNLSAARARARLAYLIQNTSRVDRSVGGQCSSITIKRDLNARTEVDYHVLRPQRTLYFPAHVRALPPKAEFMRNLRFGHENQSAGPILKVPQVNRNALCPCGSGLRYKYCHRSRKGMKRFTFGYSAGKQ